VRTLGPDQWESAGLEAVEVDENATTTPAESPQGNFKKRH
jgi:hypothetical protein